MAIGASVLYAWLTRTDPNVHSPKSEGLYHTYGTQLPKVGTLLGSTLATLDASCRCKSLVLQDDKLRGGWWPSG